MNARGEARRTYGRGGWGDVLRVMALLVAGWLWVEAGETNGVTREVYGNIGGTSLADLTNNPAFPARPTLESIQPTFEAPTDWSDNYGTRMTALVVAPQTGAYTFWIASDDQGALYLSTDETPSRRRLICSVPSWTGSREWTREASQQSAPVSLTAGRRYYVEALQKEGGGGDNLAVRWRLPDGTIEEPIPQHRLIAYGLTAPVITQQPADVTVVEGGTATFAVQLERYLGASYRWFRDGVPIAQATAQSYGMGPVALEDSGSVFHCVVTNPQGVAPSAAATLTVLADTTPPALVSVGNYGDRTVVSVVFSEPVEAATATNAAHYGVDQGVTVTRAVFGFDSRTIILTTTPMAPDTVYQVSVEQVRDRARVPNRIPPGSAMGFSTAPRRLDPAYGRPGFESPGPASRRHGVVISEIMYHPMGRADGRNLEYIEIYNAQPWFEEIGGWRLTGAVDYTFPSNTVVAARSYRVVAAAPGDFSGVHPGVAGVLGPWEAGQALPNGGGLLRLRNAQGAVLFEVEYGDEPPWPAAADGAGHSLVLARPSYGERDVRAWDASDRVGGSPGTGDTQAVHAYRGLMINEVLAHTDWPQEDYVEVLNAGLGAVDLAGCIVTDDPSTNRLVVSDLVLGPGQRGVWTASALGFALSSAGETVYLLDPGGTRVLDAVRFGGQENGVPWGRYPDGAPGWARLSGATPGEANAGYRAAEVVINEVMYDPISGDSDDEYVELANVGVGPVDLGGWRLEGGVDYTIPPGTVLGPEGYLVIARHVGRLRTNYAQLNSLNSVGDFEGRLGNGGERLVLTKPDWVVGTNAAGRWETNLIHIAVSEVTWRGGGRWGDGARGGGSSLELREGRADGGRAPNWGESDETGKRPGVRVAARGVMEPGPAAATHLPVPWWGAGAALLDEVEVVAEGGVNLVANGTFETGSAGWVFQGNHNGSSWEPGEGVGGGRSLRLRATGRGDTGANRVRTALGATLAPGTTVTLRAKARWLKGNPNLLLRLRGNWMEAPGYLLAARDLGTPGRVNSRAVGNVGPAVTEARHWPALPAAGLPVTVTAYVGDADGLAHVAVNYRRDPATNYTAVPMAPAGGGLFSAVLPAQTAGTTVAYFIEALDNAVEPAGARFPAAAPVREAVIRWGDTTQSQALGTYRLWLTQTNVARWVAEELMSNNAKDVTFVYGTNRVIYNAGAWFHGSPYHSPSYNSPVGNSCDYDLLFPGDDRLLGETDINLFRPGNGGGDGTAQAEIHGFWLAAQFGLPFLYNRPVFVWVNGQRRDDVFLDAQQPNGDFVEQWHPDDAGGDLHKIQLGFEFGDQATGANEAGYAVVGADLSRYTTTGGAMKQARYRQTWARRAASIDELHDYTNIFHLVGLVQTNAAVGTEAYTRALESGVDVEEWFKVHVTQHLYNNYDSFSYGGGQNAFAYKPQRGTWKLYLWDTDFAFGGPADDPNLFGIGGREHGPVNTHPPFARIYWQALIEAAGGMMTAARSHPILDARYNGLRAAGANVASPQGIKDFLAARRTYILAVIASNQSPFRVLSNGGADFETHRNVATLAGTAPLGVRSFLVNGERVPTTWTTVSNWVVWVPLEAGVNTLTLTGVDARGNAVGGASQVVGVRFTGVAESPGRVVINEIHYHPAVPGTSFVELLNTAEQTTFDLGGWRLEGVDYWLPAGTLLGPGEALVVAADLTLLAAHLGGRGRGGGRGGGTLATGGETGRLGRPGEVEGEEVLVDAVRYDDGPPWPGWADGFGPSLQLIDASQDNSRVGNWATARVETNALPRTLVDFTSDWRYHQTAAFTTAAWAQPGYADGAWPSGPGLLYVENAALPAPKGTPLTLGRITYYFRTQFEFRGDPEAYGLQLETVWDDGAALYLNGREVTRLRLPPGPLTYGVIASEGVGDAVLEGPFLLPSTGLVEGTNTLAVEVHQAGSGSSDIVMGMRLVAMPGSTRMQTPGAPNSVRAVLPPFPPVWLNEVQARNLAGPVDAAGEREPWVELHNAGPGPVDVGGWFLSDDPADLRRWAFPAGARLGEGGYRLVWLDGEPGEGTVGEWHAGFRPDPLRGILVLSRPLGEAVQVVDGLGYALPVADGAYGSYPEGQGIERRNFVVATPGAPNDPSRPLAVVWINEWMADNRGVLADPADGQYEDWFELYNPGTEGVDVSGWWLTDDLATPRQFRIPAGYAVPPGGFLLVWADGETGQNSVTNAELHVKFKLDAEGEAIGLFDPEGRRVDAVSFGVQARDRSEGRRGDGGDTIAVLEMATPGASNGGGGGEGPAMVGVEPLQGGQVLLSWRSVPGRRYRVEFKSVLEEPAWTALGGVWVASEEVSSVVDQVAPHRQRFYRVVWLE